MTQDRVEKLLKSKKALLTQQNSALRTGKCEEEGGCGVVGFCCTEPVAGKHIYEPSRVMHNRGNGKGGGIAAVGFIPGQLGVSRDILEDNYMLHVAYLDVSVRDELEREFITSNFDISHSALLETVEDWKTVSGLEVRPPDVCRYFIRAKSAKLDAFIAENNLDTLDRREAEDEFLNQNSFTLNRKYYASTGLQKAFVLSHGRNIMILKVVGYAEAMVEYYKIKDLKAHVWIAHQRFPTKGRVWHPGGAHPFAGINMALVHNGDFANYHSCSEYLMQRNIYPQFLTDTEVSALMVDLLHRTYHYPLEYIIEAMAPTTELDFDRLPVEKQKIYRAIQATNIHGSPDGPWFFIIARNNPVEEQLQLLGITDTAMLRPQVFSFSDGEVQVGVISSEKQAMDACLLSLSHDDARINPVADKYWNARGGSHTDGGAFIFNMEKNTAGKLRMSCTDKFGKPVPLPEGHEACDFNRVPDRSSLAEADRAAIKNLLEKNNATGAYEFIRNNVPRWDYEQIKAACLQVKETAADAEFTSAAIVGLTLLNDLKYSCGSKKRSHILNIVRNMLDAVFSDLPPIKDTSSTSAYRLIDYRSRTDLRAPLSGETVLAINARDFKAEGNDCDARLLMDAYMKGWKHFIVFKCYGQRYVGNGLGPDTQEVTIDVYGSSGDYLGSGIDGLTLNVHGNAQDQLGQIIKAGKLVIYGDVGQTFMYGAKGGHVYVLGNTAGRPLINSVGRPRVVINGTSLDFLAEAFMAGDPHNDGGFVVLNGITLNDEGEVAPLPEPYPGSNLFSLASGGAIFVRDPHCKMVEQQLNGGAYVAFDEKDWELIKPHLEENERLFNIKVEDLLTVDGELRSPLNVYRKVIPSAVALKNYPVDDEAVKAEDELTDIAV